MGQVEVAWDGIDMSEYWGKDVGGKICKFRVRDLQNNKTFGPFNGPWAVTPESLARQNLEGYNAAMEVADYGVVFAREHTQGSSPIFLAGFKELSLEEVRRLYSTLQQVATSSILDPAVKEAFKELLNIDPGLLSQWLLSLAEADLQGQFDQVYAQLLPEGLDQLEQVFLSIGVKDVRQFIKVTAQRYYEIIRAIVTAQGDEGSDSDEELEEALKDALALVTAFIEFLKTILPVEPTIIPIPITIKVKGISITVEIPMILPAGFNEEVLREFGAALAAAIARVWDWYRNSDEIIEFTSQAIMASLIIIVQYITNLNELERMLGELTELLNWGVGDRLDQLLGTIEVLKNAIVRAGWKFLGVLGRRRVCWSQGAEEDRGPSVLRDHSRRSIYRP